MKAAVIGSRNLRVKRLEQYLPEGITEIVSGGARGIDMDAQEYAKMRGIPYRIFLPDYETYGRSAPLKRNLQIIEYADMVFAFWDGRSRGTWFVIRNSLMKNVPVQVYLAADGNEEAGYKAMS